MTYPGFQAQEALRRAQVASQQSYHQSRRPRRIGFFGLIGRLLALAVMLVFLVVAAGLFLAVLHRADPHLAHQITSWLSQLT